MFTVCPFIISIDGSDSKARSSFAVRLSEELKRKSNKDSIVINPNSFNSSSTSRRYKECMNSIDVRIGKDYSRYIGYLLLAIRANYSEVVLSYAKMEKIVILDSSEIEFLSFLAIHGQSNTTDHAVDYVKRGLVTYGVQPKLRILVKNEKSDVYSWAAKLIGELKTDDKIIWEGIDKTKSSFENVVKQSLLVSSF